MKSRQKSIDPREIRQRLGLNQQSFWGRIGVTQSGGSRYEGGREMPRPVRELLRLLYIEQLDLESVTREDIEVIDYLRTTRPDLYATLKREARTATRAARGTAAGVKD